MKSAALALKSVFEGVCKKVFVGVLVEKNALNFCRTITSKNIYFKVATL